VWVHFTALDSQGSTITKDCYYVQTWRFDGTSWKIENVEAFGPYSNGRLFDN
jgi:hypothetical protein